MRFSVSSLRGLAACALAATLVHAECTREGLMSASLDWEHGSDAFPNVEVTIVMADEAHVTQNNIVLRSPLNSVMGNITAYPTPFHLYAVDTDICDILLLTVPREVTKDEQTNATLSDAVALTSVRLQIGLVDKAWEQLEILNALPGSVSSFDVAAMPKEPSAAWKASQAPATKRTRDQLIAIADKWPSAMEAQSAAGVPLAQNCVRHADGVAAPCSKAFGTSKYSYLSRRWVVDTETGVVGGLFTIDRAPTAQEVGKDLLSHEYFKIDDQGNIAGIYSVLTSYDGTKADLWQIVENTEQFDPPLEPLHSPVLCDLLHSRCIIPAGRRAKRWTA